MGAGTWSPGTFSVGTSLAAATVATGVSSNTPTYSEVGLFQLAGYAPSSAASAEGDNGSARGIYDATWTAVDSTKNECVVGSYSNRLNSSGMYGCNFGLVTNQVFGRFVPDHFTVVGTIANACSTGNFTYMAQPFILSPLRVGGGVVEARNGTDGVTQNYAGVYAPGKVSFGAENADSGTDLSARLAFLRSSPPDGTASLPRGSWTLGAYKLDTTNVTFSRPTATPADATWGAFDSLDIGLTVSDSDVSTLPIVSGADMNPTAVGNTPLTYKKFDGSPLKMRYGRIKMQNAYGSELLALPIPLEAQYWTGSYYATNTADSCTALPMSSIVMSNYTGVLAACNTRITPTSPVRLSGGKLPAPGLVLTKPGVGNRGSVKLALNVTDTASASDKTCVDATESDATAASMPWFGPNLGSRATFGIYKSPLIYRRENY